MFRDAPEALAVGLHDAAREREEIADDRAFEPVLVGDEGGGALGEVDGLGVGQGAVELEHHAPLVEGVGFDGGRGLGSGRADMDGLHESGMDGPVHGHDAAGGHEESAGFEGALLFHEFRQGVHAVLAGPVVDVHHAAGGFAFVELEVQFDADHAGCDRCEDGTGCVSRCRHEAGAGNEQASGEERDVQAMHWRNSGRSPWNGQGLRTEVEVFSFKFQGASNLNSSSTAS